ncbi:MAG: TonB family protein [Pseudanabaena sp.]|jgi:TonB family protein
MKKISEPADIHSSTGNRSLISLLFIGFVGSTCVHAAIMIALVPTLWKPDSNELEDTIEIVIDPTQIPEETIAEIPKEILVPEPVNNVDTIENPQPVEVAPVAIALAPENIEPLKEGKDAAAPDDLKPLITSSVSDTKIQTGGGSVIAKDGLGSGFGIAKTPTGFILGGKINGNPNGSKNGILGGLVNGSPNGKDTQTNAVLPTIPSQPTNKPVPKLECLSCPKPQYRGKEGTPRVTYDIAPDGRVINVRLRQSSGDPQTDRETIEAMSKWQFNPQTIPEGGRTNVKVRVTFEEDGSKFQRENEERRRREAAQLEAQRAEQRRLAEEESHQREAELAKPTTVTAPVNPAPVSPTPVPNPTLPVEPAAATVVEPTPDTPSPAPAVDLTSPPVVDAVPSLYPPVEPVTVPAVPPSSP